MANRPVPEIDVTEQLVAALLAEQAPEFAGLELVPLNRGWDNTNWRLGDDMVVRVPHRAVAAPLIEHEQKWLPILAPRFELAVPAPIHAGRPAPTIDFPWPWSIVPWLPGEQAASAGEFDRTESAYRLGRFFAALHQPAPDDLPINPHRGGPLAERQPRVDALIDDLADRVDGTAAAAIFAEAVAAPPADRAVVVHGDMHTRNLIVDDGALSAVIDWGDLTSGDRACDLAATYMLCPDDHAMVWNYAGGTDAQWTRARGWAVNFALLYLANGDDDPVQAGVGVRLLASLGVDVDS